MQTINNIFDAYRRVPRYQPRDWSETESDIPEEPETPETGPDDIPKDEEVKDATTETDDTYKPSLIGKESSMTDYLPSWVDQEDNEEVVPPEESQEVLNSIQEYISDANVRYQITPTGNVVVADKMVFKGGPHIPIQEDLYYQGDPLKINKPTFNDLGYRNALLDSQLVRESWLIPNLISDADAMGIAQFRNPTWETVKRNNWVTGENPSPFNPTHAIEAQQNYMEYLYNLPYVANAPDSSERVARTLAAYNWGHDALRKTIDAYGSEWRDHLPKETKKYIEFILDRTNKSILTGEYTPYYIR